MCDIVDRCVGISYLLYRNRKGIRERYICRQSILKILRYCNALFGRIIKSDYPRALLREALLPLFHPFFFFSKTSCHRNGICIIASDCLSSYHGRHIHASGPSVRSSDPNSYANGWVHRRTTARN